LCIPDALSAGSPVGLDEGVGVAGGCRGALAGGLDSAASVRG
jgi:hypothetical protein